MQKDDSTTADNSAKLAEWANDKKNRGYVRLFLPGSWSWDRMMQFMTGLVYDCVDTTLKMDDFSGETKTITCGKAKERRLTLVVAVCD